MNYHFPIYSKLKRVEYKLLIEKVLMKYMHKKKNKFTIGRIKKMLKIISLLHN